MPSSKAVAAGCLVGVALMAAAACRPAEAEAMPPALGRHVLAEVQEQLYLRVDPGIRLALVEAYLALDDVPGAAQAAEAIATPELRYQAYKAIGVALAGNGHLDAARAYADKLEGDRWQGGVVLAIASWQARHGDAAAAAQTLADRSSEVYGNLRTPSSKSAHIARELAIGGHFAKAHQVLEAVEPFERASALDDIARAEHAAGRTAQALRTLRAALDSAKSEPYGIGRRVLLNSIATALIEIGAPAEARVVLLALRTEYASGPSWEKPARDLFEVALLESQSGDGRAADETLRMVADRVAADGTPQECPAPIQRLAHYYAYLGEYDAAQSLAARAPSERWREVVLVEIVGAKALTKDVGGARRLAESLKDDSTRSAAYAAMAEAAALNGEDASAFALIDRVEGRARLHWMLTVPRRTYPLRAVAAIAAYDGRLATALHAVDALDDGEEQDIARAEIAEILASRGDFEGAVALAHKIDDRNRRLATLTRLVIRGGAGAPLRPDQPSSQCFDFF